MVCPTHLANAALGHFGSEVIFEDHARVWLSEVRLEVLAEHNEPQRNLPLARLRRFIYTRYLDFQLPLRAKHWDPGPATDYRGGR